MGEIWYDKNHNEPQKNRFWWREPKTQMHTAVHGFVRTLMHEQKYRMGMLVHCIRLYGNLDIPGIDADQYARGGDDDDHIAYNIIESAIDTIHADIIANRGRVMFLTDGGKWKERQRAQGLTKFIDGQFYHTGMHTDVGPMACLDALVTGTGFVKPCVKFGKPGLDRVLPGEIWVDDAEARDGKPRSMFQVKTVPRESVVAEFARDNPALAEKLKQTREAERDGVRKRTLADVVDIIEAWHLPAYPVDDDTPDADVIRAGGVHCICVENTVIKVKPWRKPYFPPTPLRYKQRNLGYWGKGPGEILSGSQVSINELLWKIHMSLRLAGPKVFVHPGSELNEAHFNNEIWGIIETLEPPHMALFESVPPDLFRQLLHELEQAYALVGVNMIAAGGGLPAGLEGGSGKALRLYSDTKSKRFIAFKNNWDQWHIDAATKLIDMTRDVERDGRPYELLVPSEDGTARMVKWSDVNLPRDKYIMQAWPTSYLSSTPSSRIRDVEDLLKVFPQMQDHVMHLLDFPDIKAVAKVLASETEIARQFIERVLYDGEELSPEPMMNFALTLELARKYYLQGILEKAPEDNLENLRQFMVLIENQLKQAEAASAPPPAAPAPLALPPAPAAAPGAPSGPLPPGPPLL